MTAMLADMRVAVDREEVDQARFAAAAVERRKGSRDLAWIPKLLCGWMFWYTTTKRRGEKVTLVVGPVGADRPGAPGDPAGQTTWSAQHGWTARCYAAGDVVPCVGRGGQQEPWRIHSEDWRGNSSAWMSGLAKAGERIAAAASPGDTRAAAAAWVKG